MSATGTTVVGCTGMDASVHTAPLAVPVHFLVAKVLDAPTTNPIVSGSEAPTLPTRCALASDVVCVTSSPDTNVPVVTVPPIVKLRVAAIAGGGLHVGGVPPEP